MADDVQLQRLYVSLEARFNKYERALAKAQRDTRRTFSRMEKRSNALNASFSRIGGTLAAAFAGGAAVRGMQRFIDTSIRIENTLKVAGLEGQRLKGVYDSLYDSANRNVAPLESLVQLYGRAAQVQNELGVSTQELLGFTDNVAVALRVAGTSAQESSGALLQLSQALGSGIVRAEEFNSILEGALPIAQAAAAGLEEAGGSVARLRQLVIDGKVSSEAFFRAFEAGSVILEEKVATAELTTSQAFVRLQNVLIDTAGKFDDATGASGMTASALESLATYVENVGDYFEENESRILGFFQALAEGAEGLESWKKDFREALGLDVIDDFLEGTSLIEGTFGRSSQQVASDAARMRQAIAGAEQQVREYVTAALESGRLDYYPANVRATFQSLLDALNAGELNAVETQAALIAIGDANPLLGGITGRLNQLIEHLRTTRAEANATARAIWMAQQQDIIAIKQASEGSMGGGGGPSAPPPVSVDPVSIADYPIGGGGGAGGTSSRDSAAAAAKREAEAVKELIQRLRDERDMIGKSAVEKRILNELRSANVEATSAEGREIAKLVRQIEAETTARERQKKKMQEIADVLGDTFSSLFEPGGASNFMDSALTNFASVGQSNIDGLFDLENWGADGQYSWMLDAVKTGSEAGTKAGTQTGLKSLAKGSGSTLLNAASAGIGGLGIGYQAQDPAMGALGGALSGVAAGAAGGPVGMAIGGIVGGMGGKIGGLPKPLKPANDDRSEKKGAA